MSKERAAGFNKIIDQLEKELLEVVTTNALDFKLGIVNHLKNELLLYKQMYKVETDIVEGKLKRAPHKYLLKQDGWTLRLNPNYVKQEEPK